MPFFHGNRHGNYPNGIPTCDVNFCNLFLVSLATIRKAIEEKRPKRAVAQANIANLSEGKGFGWDQPEKGKLPTLMATRNPAFTNSPVDICWGW